MQKGINPIKFSKDWNKLDALFKKKVSLLVGKETFKGNRIEFINGVETGAFARRRQRSRAGAESYS